jgi:hypothetical protein
MWARVVEIMIGCWLLMSPFIFRVGKADTATWANDLGCGAAVIALAWLSYWHPLRHIHLISVGVAIWLFVFGRFLSVNASLPQAQNDIVVGLLLLMFALVPNEASRPPQGYRAPVLQQ